MSKIENMCYIIIKIWEEGLYTHMRHQAISKRIVYPKIDMRDVSQWATTFDDKR